MELQAGYGANAEENLPNVHGHFGLMRRLIRSSSFRAQPAVESAILERCQVIGNEVAADLVRSCQATATAKVLQGDWPPHSRTAPIVPVVPHPDPAAPGDRASGAGNFPPSSRICTKGQGGSCMKKVWTKPQFVKISVGMEINSYESAKL
jgi:coenzyme PQQ precursor peptide PqqA